MFAAPVRRCARALVGAAALAALAALATGPARAADVSIVLGGDTESYREVADAVKSELARGAAGVPSIEVRSAHELGRGAAPQARLIVAVGTLAARAVSAAASRVPVINALLPRATHEAIANGQSARPLSAVYLDQPLSRQLELLRIALPEHRRVGLLLGSESRDAAGAILKAAAARRLTATFEEVVSDRHIQSALQRLLGESDVMLAVPDSIAFNSNTLPGILLASYRAGVPLIGFSPAYVRAGALLAVYSTPAQIGAQAGEMARQALAGMALPPPQFPREFEVGVNPHVARSLGLALADESALRRAVAERERAP